MKALNLEQLPYLTAINLVLADITGIHTINVKGCPNLANDFSWVNNWYNRKSTVDSKCTLIMDNVNWTGAAAEDLVNLAKIGTLDLKGKVALESITLEQINALMDAFGESAFDRNSDFYIDAPAAIFISGRTELVEGESEKYSAVVFGADVERVEWQITSGSNSYVTLDATTGLLTVGDGYGSGTIGLRANVYTNEGRKVADTSITIKAIVYPTQSNTSIAGNAQLENEYETYILEYPADVTGQVSAAWSLSGLDEYAVIDSYDDRSCVIKKLKDAAGSVAGTLTCTLSKASGASLFSVTKAVEVVNPNIAETDPEVCRLLYSKGLCASETFVTKDEAALIEYSDLYSNNKSIFAGNSAILSFNGFKHFTKITELGYEFFGSCANLKSIELPEGIVKLGASVFSRCASLEEISLPKGVTELTSYMFGWCSSLKKLTLKGVTKARYACFLNCTKVHTLVWHMPTAPVEQNSSLENLGKDNKGKGINMLYVPEGATGYDSGVWLNTLLNPEVCDFTINYTL
jgi:hypothetical protein